MDNQTKKIAGIAAAGIGVAALAWKYFKRKPAGAEPVKSFDIQRYLGKWYEIARFDYRFEKNLKNTTARYSMNKDGSIKVVNRDYDFKHNKWKQAIGIAKFRGNQHDGNIKVSFFRPFYSGYNVLAVDPGYKYALVAGRSLDYLWLLSREKFIPRDVKETYLDKARQLGYQTANLRWVEQD